MGLPRSVHLPVAGCDTALFPAGHTRSSIGPEGDLQAHRPSAGIPDAVCKVAVVIEDDDDIRSLVIFILTQAGFTAHGAANGREGLHLVREAMPDLVTVDLGLPDIDGVEVNRQIRNISDAYILMISGRTAESDIILSLETGADDYIMKPFASRVLRSRVDMLQNRPRTVFQRGTAGTDASAARDTPTARANQGTRQQVFHNGLELDVPARQVQVDGGCVALTRSEFDLLQAIILGGRTVQTKAALSLVLHGRPDTYCYVGAAEERAVEGHIGNIRRKLGEDPARPRWIKTIRGVGYRSTDATTSQLAAGPRSATR